MTVSPRIRRTAASVAALGSAAAGFGLAAPANAIPLPATAYGPTADATLTSGTYVAGSPPLPTQDYATINASASAIGVGGAAITGYAYTCGGAGGGLVAPVSTATGAECRWPFVASPPLRPVGIRANDGNGLYSSKEIDWTTGHKSPTIVFTATPNAGANELTATVNTTGTTSIPAGNTLSGIVACGLDGTGIMTATGADCTYTTPGVKTVTVTEADTSYGIQSVRTAHVTVIDKATAVMNVNQTAAYAVTADINGSHVDTNLTGVYAIDWGDGVIASVTPSTSTVAHHTYSSAGHYSVKLTVTDSSTGTATTTTALDVTATAPQPGVYRYGGTTRFQTAIDVSSHNWDALSNVSAGARHPQAVVLARSDGYADALAGVPLAAKKKGPLLLTPTGSLDPGVQTEIQRILPTTGANNTIYIVGGLSAVSQNVENQLTTLGYHVVRFGEADRFATALKIATDPNGMNNPAHVVVATGYNFPDALAAGPYAALPSVNAAIVLSQNNAFDAATGTLVAAKLGAGGNVTAIGGQAMAAVGALPGSAGKFTSYAGNDRYETAAKVAGWGGISPFAATAPVGVSTGLQFPDALTGGAMMAQLGGPMLLTDPHALSSPSGSVLTTVKPTVMEVDIFGGAAALLPATTDGIVTAVNGVKKNFT